MEIFNQQKYEKLHKHHSDLGVPWTDPTFPASDASIGVAKLQSLPKNIQWKRPKDIAGDQARLCVEGVSCTDVTQGKLGNCWFVAACCVLAGCKEMWERVVPEAKDQEYDHATSTPAAHSGVFRFRFWRFGKWVEVVVDDLLPTFTNANNQTELLFTHSSANKEFWGALLEKAYAKLHGGYATLDGGNLSDALVDFTSGVSEMIDLRVKAETFQQNPEEKKKLFDTLAHELDEHALMCAAITANSEGEMEERTELGLVKGHAYGITAVKKIPLGETNLINFFKGREKLPLIRLQNPWGQKEWTGAFSDGSPEWTNISDKEKEKLGLTFEEDGEFWMPFDDFLLQFTEMSICRLINTSVFSFSKTWRESQLFGSWRCGRGLEGEDGYVAERAGGCLNHRDTFLHNPQYRFDSPAVQEDDEAPELIVQLSQSDARSSSSAKPLIDKRENMTIGFHIMKVEANRMCRVHHLVPGSGVETSDYIKTKHIFLRTDLPKSGGRFVIVPTTFNPREETDFLLRVFTEHSRSSKVQELVLEKPIVPWYKRGCCCCAEKHQVVTRLTVVGAKGLEKRTERFGGKVDPYLYIKCEGHKVRSEAMANNQNPSWNFSAVFYRKDPAKPIKVQIWNSNLMVDSFIGQTLLVAQSKFDQDDMRPKVETLTLVGRGKTQRAEKVPGEIQIKVETYEDLTKI